MSVLMTSGKKSAQLLTGKETKKKKKMPAAAKSATASGFDIHSLL